MEKLANHIYLAKLLQSTRNKNEEDKKKIMKNILEYIRINKGCFNDVTDEWIDQVNNYVNSKNNLSQPE